MSEKPVNSDQERQKENERLLVELVKAAEEMDYLLHLRLRYCPEAQWIEGAYFNLKAKLAAWKGRTG